MPISGHCAGFLQLTSRSDISVPRVCTPQPPKNANLPATDIVTRRQGHSVRGRVSPLISRQRILSLGRSRSRESGTPGRVRFGIIQSGFRRKEEYCRQPACLERLNPSTTPEGGVA